MDRSKLLDLAYRNTHRDFKGTIDGRKSIMVFRNGSCLVFLDDLSDDELRDRLPAEKRNLLPKKV